ncbi:MAG: polymer-forming cytoskeletal protein [Rubrobacter sp.]|jgi:cytoskeletal protein CcmA (bactofilin family)|nr:polymer-forming cytoskeletal protein [Rubrobacter sp.]
MTVAAPRQWPIMRPLAAIFAVSAAFLLFFGSSPAHAENKMFGDAVVERGQSASGVSTSIGDIEVLGEVEGDVRSASGDIVIYGPVAGNVRSGMGDVEITAPVEGGVEAGFGDVYIDSEVAGDVAVERGKVELGPRADVVGKVYHGSGEFSAAPTARFDGTMSGMASDLDGGGSDASDLLGFIGWLLAASAFAAATVLASVVTPRSLGASSRKVGEAPVRSLLAGVGSVVAAIVLFMVLLVSGIGIPILVLLAPIYLAFVLFGAIVVAYFVGRKVAMATGRYRAGNTFAAIVGAVILACVYFLPLGLLLFFVLALLGAGAAVMALLARGRPHTPFDGRR